MALWVVSLFTTDVSTRRVSPGYYLTVFGVCMGLVSRDDPLAQTVLYPRQYSSEALPK
jgi:hypothetical protein